MSLQGIYLKQIMNKQDQYKQKLIDTDNSMVKTWRKGSGVQYKVEGAWYMVTEVIWPWEVGTQWDI